jgi:hypothetical protein
MIEEYIGKNVEEKNRGLFQGNIPGSVWRTEENHYNP